MSKFSTLNYLINSYQAGKREIEQLQFHKEYNTIQRLNVDQSEFEPSQESIQAILNFASQYEVLQSEKTGNIELNLN
jgi:hypothetical protein